MNPQTPYDPKADQRYSPNQLQTAEEATNPSTDSSIDAPTNQPDSQTNDAVSGLAAAEQRAKDQPDEDTKANDTVGRGYTGGAPKKVTGKVKSALKSGGKKKYLILGSIGGTALIVLVSAMMLLYLVGPLKEIHFATVLRSVGFARFNMVMKQQYNRTLFNAAVLSDTSTGDIRLKNRSLIDKLRGVNPQKQLTTLGQEGTVKFDFQKNSFWGSGEFQGITINGKTYNLDTFSGNKPYAKLSPREKLAVQNKFVEAVQTDLSDRLGLEGRAFRSSVYNGLRQVTGINMSKWANKARDFLGKSPAEARKLDVADTVREVTGGEIAQSSIPAVADEVASEAAGNPPSSGIKESVMKGVDTAGKVSVVVLASTVVCVVNDLNNSFIQAQKDYEPQMDRLGHDALTTADQIKKGDTTMVAVSAENSRWDGAENSILYKQATNQPIAQADMQQLSQIPSANPTSPFATTVSILNTGINTALSGPAQFIPGVSTVQSYIKDKECGVLLNPNVQWTIAGTEVGVSIIGAVVGAVGVEASVQAGLRAALDSAFQLGAGMGLGQAIGAMIDSALGSYTAFTGAETGSSLYNDTSLGVNSLAQTGNRQITFGGPMSNADAAKTDQVALQTLKDANKTSSFSNRYFAISNPFSLLGSMVASVPTSFSEIKTAVPSMIGSLLSSPEKMFSSLLGSHRVYAAADNQAIINASYPVTQWGWTSAEQAKIDTDPSYLPQELTTYYASHMNDKDSNGETFYSRYGQCYTPVLNRDIPSFCTSDYLGTDLALHWRLYNADYSAANCLGAADLCVQPADGSSILAPSTASN